MFTVAVNNELQILCEQDRIGGIRRQGRERNEEIGGGGVDVIFYVLTNLYQKVSI